MVENLKLIRDILLKSFIVGFILLLFSFLMFMLFNDFIVSIWASWYSVKTEMVGPLIILLFGIFKSLVFILFLIPAIAIHWTIKKLAWRRVTHSKESIWWAKHPACVLFAHEYWGFVCNWDALLKDKYCWQYLTAKKETELDSASLGGIITN